MILAAKFLLLVVLLILLLRWKLDLSLAVFAITLLTVGPVRRQPARRRAQRLGGGDATARRWSSS